MTAIRTNKRKKNYVSYLRVSTHKQSRKHGIDAQRNAVETYLNGGQWTIVKEFVEIASGGKADRVLLDEAIEYCIKNNATLVVAKLDRLSRDIEHTAKLIKLRRSGKFDFVCVDCPTASDMELNLRAVIAEEERQKIRERVKEGLEQAKKKGVKLGASNPKVRRALKNARRERSSSADDFASAVYTKIEKLLKKDWSLYEIVSHLNHLGIKTRRGGQWQINQLQRVLDRVGYKR